VEDHSFLTKAQALWSDLIDLGQYKNAESWLLFVHRYAPESHLNEIRDVFHKTQELLACEKN
jgi:hypothetical protein